MLRVSPKPGQPGRVAAGGGELAEARTFGAQSDVRASGRARRPRQLFFASAMKINFRRIDHVQVCIPPGAEEQAREFYGRVLGLEEIEKPAPLKKNGGLWFKVADLQLHVGVEETVAASKRHPAFEIEDARAVRSYLERHGVRTRDETDVEGVVRFSLFDPFGNRIELLEKKAATSAGDQEISREQS